MTNNEKWQGNSKNENSDAGRDGRNYERKDGMSNYRENRGSGNYSRGSSRYGDRNSDDRPAYRRNDENGNGYGGRRSYGNNRPNQNYGHRSSNGYNSYNGGERRPYGDRDNRSYGERDNRSYSDRDNKSFRPRINKNPDRKIPFKRPGEELPNGYIETRFDNKQDGVVFRKPKRKRIDNYDPNSKYSHRKQAEYLKNFVDPTKPVRLNKFLANAGICSRREADEFIQAGVISVNGEIVTELGVKVMQDDKVMFHNQLVRSERKVYLLLNKPKNCVTTAEDTHDRLTVVDLVKGACSERIYPVGRLDRNTTGVILLTNDGDLASKLTHPKYDKKKIYHVALDKDLEIPDFEAILGGVTLDDGIIAADALEFVKDGDRKQVGIEIHSGQNRVVRRIFEKLGYKVIRLDRVYFAGLTKRNLSRGKYRFLNDREVNMLKMGAYK